MRLWTRYAALTRRTLPSSGQNGNTVRSDIWGSIMAINGNKNTAIWLIQKQGETNRHGHMNIKLQHNIYMKLFSVLQELTLICKHKRYIFLRHCRRYRRADLHRPLSWNGGAGVWLAGGSSGGTELRETTVTRFQTGHGPPAKHKTKY